MHFKLYNDYQSINQSVIDYRFNVLINVIKVTVTKTQVPRIVRLYACTSDIMYNYSCDYFFF